MHELLLLKCMNMNITALIETSAQSGNSYLCVWRGFLDPQAHFSDCHVDKTLFIEKLRQERELLKSLLGHTLTEEYCWNQSRCSSINTQHALHTDHSEMQALTVAKESFNAVHPVSWQYVTRLSSGAHGAVKGARFLALLLFGWQFGLRRQIDLAGTSRHGLRSELARLCKLTPSNLLFTLSVSRSKCT